MDREYTAQYTSLSEIGLVKGSETMAAIATNLTEDSVITYTIDGTYNISAYPYLHGEFTANKISNIVTFTFSDEETHRFWNGLSMVDPNSGSFVWSGWEQGQRTEVYGFPTPTYNQFAFMDKIITDLSVRVEKALIPIKDIKFSQTHFSLYVSPNGNDIEGNGTQQNPYKTITTAFFEAEKYEGHNAVYIMLDNGVYEENLLVFGKKHYSIRPSNSVNTQVVIKNPSKGASRFYSSSIIFFYNIIFENVNDNAGIAFCGSSAYFDNCTFKGNKYDVGNLSSFLALYGASVHFDRCTFENSYIPVSSNCACTISLYRSTIKNCTWGLWANSGFVFFSGSTMENVTNAVMEMGNGKVYKD